MPSRGLGRSDDEGREENQEWQDDARTLEIRSLDGGTRRSGTRPSSSAKLIVREPGLDPVSVFLEKASITLGRGADCDARLHSPYVSRQHVTILANEDGHSARSLEAQNGTTVNGRTFVGDHHLSHGDEIRLADVSVWYIIEVPVDASTPPLALGEKTDSPLPRLYVSLDEERHRVWLAERDAEVALAPNEFKLLSHLWSRSGRVASREELMTAVWGEDEYDVDSLYRLVQRVKEKIEPDPSKPRYLISHRGLGYSLEVAPLSITEGGSV